MKKKLSLNNIKQRYSKTLFKDKGDKAEEAAEAFYDAREKAKSEAFIDGITSIPEAITQLPETAKSLYYALNNPNETIDKIYVSAKDWEKAYESALKNDPALAGKMQGYLEANLTGTIPAAGGVVIGGASSLAKGLKKVTEVTRKADSKLDLDPNNIGRNNAKYNQEVAEHIRNKPAGEISNIDAINKLNAGKLPGVSTNNRVGIPREMAPTSTPNDTAKDFIDRFIGNKNIIKHNNLGNDKTPKYYYELDDGTSILYRPGGSSGKKTTDTTATVEINSSEVKAINNNKPVKLKFPVKSEVK